MAVPMLRMPALPAVSFRRLWRWLLRVALYGMLGSALLVLLLRWLPVPFTALMVERELQAWMSGRMLDLRHQWLSWDELPDSLKMAVIAAEDQKFATHYGFDVEAIQAALQHNSRGRTLRGASTISQQVAKNLFLWSGRNWIRKGLEVWFTLLIETLWSKERILQVYLNSVEWADGVFGAQAAAQHHFHIAASRLNPEQASRLAAVLPNPREWSAASPPSRIRARASWIRVQSGQLGGSSYLQQLSD